MNIYTATAEELLVGHELPHHLNPIPERRNPKRTSEQRVRDRILRQMLDAAMPGSRVVNRTDRYTLTEDGEWKKKARVKARQHYEDFMSRLPWWENFILPGETMTNREIRQQILGFK